MAITGLLVKTDTSLRELLLSDGPAADRAKATMLYGRFVGAAAVPGTPRATGLWTDGGEKRAAQDSLASCLN
jgi:hypothetical protein